MMNRNEVVEPAMEFLKGKENACLAVRDIRKPGSKYEISFNDFEKQLEASDFFIAPPGNGMPHCHNIMEALSRGCVPITNYDRWLMPQLQDGVNCLSFRDKEGLERALSMNEDEVKKMRQAAKDYYDRYCSPDAVYKLLSSYFGKHGRTMLLVNNEGTSIDYQKQRKTIN